MSRVWIGGGGHAPRSPLRHLKSSLPPNFKFGTPTSKLIDRTSDSLSPPTKNIVTFVSHLCFLYQPHNSSLPISLTDDIREYFGDTIAMYFGFLGFYSLSLVPPVLLVVVFALSGAHEQTKNTVFAILNLVWGTVFLEAWKRRCSEISFKWGTLKAGIGVLML